MMAGLSGARRAFSLRKNVSGVVGRWIVGSSSPAGQCFFQIFSMVSRSERRRYGTITDCGVVPSACCRGIAGSPNGRRRLMAIGRDFSLEDKYRREEGRVILSGIQALVRLPLDQHRADKRRGLRTATLISGYRGSPLGGLDVSLERNRQLLQEHHVTFLSGVNEDLGATAVFGSQLANLYPRPKYDGVLGVWYGKAPGVDRTGDVFKHANFAGVGRNGGVLALAGDDPTAKSSTIPSHSEAAFYDALIPVLYPGNVQEILDLGRLGFELSRYSGLWVGFKIATNVADEVGSAETSPDRVTITDPGFEYEGGPSQAHQNPALIAPFSLETEREIYYGRLEAAKAFARANRLK